MPENLKYQKGFMKKGSVKFTNIIDANQNFTSLNQSANIFSNVEFSDSKNIIKISDTRAKLLKGFKFNIRAGILPTAISNLTTGVLGFRIWNVTKGEWIGDEMSYIPTTYNGGETSRPNIDFDFISLEDTEIELRVVTLPSGTFSLYFGKKTNFVRIEEMEAYITPTFDDRYLIQPLQNNTEITVGTGGNFTTITDALNWLAKRKPATTTVKATIKLLSGFIVKENVYIIGGDYSWIQIDSVDATVYVDRATLIASTSKKFMWFDNCRTPIINVLFELSVTTDTTNTIGLLLDNNSSCIIKNGKGFQKFTYVNGFVLSSMLWCSGSKFNGVSVSQFGLYLDNCATAFASSGEATLCTSRGYYSGVMSRLDCRSSNGRKTTGSDSTGDFIIEYGGNISLSSASLGGTSVTVNTMTASGIIYKV